MPDGTAAGVGHNSGFEFSNDQFYRFVRDQSELDAKIDALKVDRKKLRKQAKADGFRLVDLDAAQRVSDLSRTDAEDKMRHFIHYIRLLKTPIGEQISLELDEFIDPTSEDDDVDEKILADSKLQAKAEGFKAGVYNKDPKENPHTENSDLRDAWLEGYHEGQKRADSETVQPMSKEDTDD